MGGSPVHVHIGAGRLGLGLVVPITSRAGLHVVCANRPGTSAEKIARYDHLVNRARYSLTVKDTGERQAVSPGEFIALDAAGLSRLGEVVESPDAVLLTTAVGCSGLDALVPTLHDLLDRRRDAGVVAPLFVVPCENTIGRAYEVLKGATWPGVHFLDAVVDRICYIVVQRKDGEVEVEVENHGSWVIGAPPTLPGDMDDALRSALASALARRDITLVPDSEPYRLRKRWLVNGPHLALAILAHASESPTYVFLDDFMHDHPEIVRQVMAEYVDRLRLEELTFDAAENRAIAETTVDRFTRSQDRIDRILRRFAPSTLEEFIRLDLFPKVCEPARALHGTPERLWPQMMTDAVTQSLRMIETGDRYFAR